MLLIAALTVLLCQTALATVEDLDCGRVPPSLWCKNDEIAKKCGVADQCGTYKKESSNKKLLITVLFEGLCPDCQQFISGALYNDVYEHFQKYVDIELVPYGNAHKLSNGTVQCQHGPKECEVNLHEACAIHYLPKPLPFIYCLELKLKMGISLDDAAQSCYLKNHVSHIVYDQILHCIKSQKGQDLIDEAAKRTEAAYPDQHKYVPWLYFNNVSLANSQFLIHDLPVSICDWLVGEKPDFCSGIGRKHTRVGGYTRH
ncbi:Gamma-interferon-inducible lysosomal thiol reductase [Aphelenchoides bicaudatus]|nr:Gamma-interferon-inducible lysosomal thiol reductase [Aphelenchoides bicaudatus]